MILDQSGKEVVLDTAGNSNDRGLPDHNS